MSKPASDREGFNLLGVLFVGYTLFLQAQTWAMIIGKPIRIDDTACWYYFWFMIACAGIGELLRWTSAHPLKMNEEFFVTRLTLNGVFLHLWVIPRMILSVEGMFTQQSYISSGFDAISCGAVILFTVQSCSRLFHESHELKRRLGPQKKKRAFHVHSASLPDKRNFLNN